MPEYKKDRSKKNIDRTAKILDRMLVNGRVDPATGKRRKATLEDVNAYLQMSDFDSISEFNKAMEIVYPALGDYFNEFMFGYGNHVLAVQDTLQTGNTPDNWQDIKSEYKLNLKKRNVSQQLNRLENQASSDIARTAGMMSTMGPMMKVEDKIRKGTQAAGLGPKTSSMVSVPATGAIEGGLYGSSEVVDNLIEDDGKALEKTIGMLTMGGAGALGSVLGFTVFNLGQRAGRPLFNFFGGGSEVEANKLLLDTVKRGESEVTGRRYQTVDDAIAELAERRQAAPHSQPVMADLNEDARLSAAAVVEGMSDDIRDPATKFFRNRQMGMRNPNTLVREGGQADRIQQKVEELTGIPESNLFKDVGTMKEAKMKEAEVGYKQAYTQSPIDDSTPQGQEIMSLMFEPDFQAAYKKGLEINRKKRLTDDSIPEMRPTEAVFTPENNFFSIVELDYTQRGFRDLQNIKGKASDLKTAMGPTEFAADVGTVTKFQDLLGELSPQWRKTFDRYATDSKAERAMEAGYKSLNRSPKAVEAEIENMTAGERDWFKLGAAQSVYDFMGEGVGLGTNVAKMFDEQPKKTAVIQQIFGDFSKLRDFMKQVITENEANRTSAFMNQSQTRRIGQKQKQIEAADSGVQQAVNTAATVTYSPVWAARELATGSVSKNPFKAKRSQRVSTLLGGALMEPIPAKQEEILRYAERLVNRQPVKRRGRRKKAAGVLGRMAIDQRRRQLEEAQYPQSIRGKGILFN